MRISARLPLVFLLISFTFTSCFKLVSTSKDVELGTLTSHQIHADQKKYPLLDKQEYPQAYVQINRVINNIITSPEIEYKDIFAYDYITIIHDDDVVNAFCTPGGYIFVYTGLIKLAKNEDQLAAVIGHEIAHAELRPFRKETTTWCG